jgi:hypothetical protein
MERPFDDDNAAAASLTEALREDKAGERRARRPPTVEPPAGQGARDDRNGASSTEVT